MPAASLAGAQASQVTTVTSPGPVQMGSTLIIAAPAGSACAMPHQIRPAEVLGLDAGVVEEDAKMSPMLPSLATSQKFKLFDSPHSKSSASGCFQMSW